MGLPLAPLGPSSTSAVQSRIGGKADLERAVIDASETSRPSPTTTRAFTRAFESQPRKESPGGSPLCGAPFGKTRLSCPQHHLLCLVLRAGSGTSGPALDRVGSLARACKVRCAASLGGRSYFGVMSLPATGSCAYARSRTFLTEVACHWPPRAV